MCQRVCESPNEFEAVHAQLKTTACPHCKSFGNLIRHGYLRGYDKENRQARTVRGWRIYCSKRGRATGCGRTFSVWWASKVKRLFLTVEQLWDFLKHAARSGNKMQAFRRLNSGLSSSAPYRIWNRFLAAQSAIRTALHRKCEPPKSTARQPAEHTLAHLEAAFRDHSCPIAAFQIWLQASFM